MTDGWVLDSNTPPDEEVTPSPPWRLSALPTDALEPLLQHFIPSPAPHVVRDESDVAPHSQEGVTSAGTSVARKNLKRSGCKNQFDIASQLFKRRLKPPSDLVTIYKHPNPFETLCSFQKKHKGVHNTKLTEGTHRPAQKPNQRRLLSTSCISWHSMSRVMWQLNATFATSQS